jgi:hypothetical protein
MGSNLMFPIEKVIVSPGRYVNDPTTSVSPCCVAVSKCKPLTGLSRKTPVAGCTRLLAVGEELPAPPPHPAMQRITAIEIWYAGLVVRLI